MSSISSRHLYRNVLLATLCMAPVSAFAQSASESPPEKDIVVTALNRTHDVNVGAFGAKDPLDVPITIQSLGAQQIEAQRVRNLTDALKGDPSVSETSAGAGFDLVRIRGFTVDWTNTLRADGLSLAPYQDVPFENIERLDLLKGPSGFLYGFNSPGGTVNYIIKRPTATPFFNVTGEVRQYGGLYGHVDASGAVGGNDILGYRLNLAAETVGDFTHANDIERYFAGLNVDLRLADNLVLQVNSDYQYKAVSAQPLIGPQLNGAMPPDIDPRTLLGQPWLQFKARTHDLGGKLDYTINDKWFVVVQGNYSVNVRDAAFVDIYNVAANGDILDGDYVLAKDQKYTTLSAQAFVSGKFDTGPIGHDMILGLSHRYYEALEGGYFFDPLTVGNILRPVYAPAPASIPTLPKNLNRNKQQSAFFSDFISFGEHFQTLVGLRYIKYFNQRTLANGTVQAAYEQNSWVPSVALMYKPTKSMTLYASYAQGLEQGGFAPASTVNAGEIQKPIKSEQYEAGVKARVGGVDLGAAVFQITKALEFTNAGNRYVQDGQQRHRGVELSAGGRVTRDLTLNAGIAYLDTVQIGTVDPSMRNKETANAPKWQGSITGDYRLPVADDFYANLGFFYVGERWLDAQNTSKAPDYIRVDAGLRYSFDLKDTKLTLRANLKNVFNKFYWVVGQEYASVYPGMPRTFYLSATVGF